MVMANETLVIKAGRVIDPAQSVDEITDVTISAGKVVNIGKAKTDGDKVIDASGKIVCPGLIDMHVHLREPGNEEAETIASGCAAAVAGGFTSIACMPNTDPAIDTEAMVEFVCRQAARAGLCNVFPIGAITKGREGKELAEMGQMVRAGAVAFSDDGRGISDPVMLLRAMQYVSMFDKPLIQHCEEPSLAGSGVMNAGATATRLGLPGIPAMAEEMMLQRDLLIVRSMNGRYHAAHVSTEGSVELVRKGKQDGLNLTTEVCPHHLLLTEDTVTTYDTVYKVNPPLRKQSDLDACIAGVVDGTIDCLVTDHAPHGREEKEFDFQTAPFGMIGLEVSLGLFAKALITAGHLDWPELLAKMTIRPATVLGIDKGTLKAGADADVAIIDPNLTWKVDTLAFQSHSRNCPFDGWELTGRATHTIVNGVVRYVLNTEKAPSLSN